MYCTYITARHGRRVVRVIITLNINFLFQYASIQRSLLPVVIFIGGELYSFFDSSVYSGAELAAADIIVATFNYRLGVFGNSKLKQFGHWLQCNAYPAFLLIGFFSMEDTKAGGNMGLFDQYLAIEWVHENIREFGGDPTKVTLMGHSAGAASAVFHMTSPRAAGKFQGVLILIYSSWVTLNLRVL
jgi:carboxylesterase type B